MQRQLRDGLILRSLSAGYASDQQRLPQFYYDVFVLDASPETEQPVIPWTQDLMNGHPTVTHDDIFVVVDPTKDDMIVSATLLIPQTWRYEDVEFAFGRPEIVATHPDYRRRGLVWALFEAVHERSATLGLNVLGITGIPYFYRQFGYTMAVDLGAHAMVSTAVIKDREQPQFTLRPATEGDIPDLIRWDRYIAKQRLLSVVYTTDTWRYGLHGRQADSAAHLVYLVIVNPEGNGVGYVAMRNNNFHSFHRMLSCHAYIIGEEASYLETFDDVLFGMKQWGKERFGECPPVLQFATGMHESIGIMVDRMVSGSIRRREYAWYLRVADLRRFLCDIAPMLERRLEGSGAHRYSGTLAIGFYEKDGITLHFERGRLKEITVGKVKADIEFPNHLFLNVLFGYHSADEIRSILPDVSANPKAAVLLPVLFPKKRSWIMPLS